MLSRFVCNICNLTKNTYIFIKNNRSLTIILTIASIIYPIILIVISWGEIKNLGQIDFSLVFFLIILYLLSALIQLINWIIILRQNIHHFFDDFKIFSQTFLLQRLPGGFWQWLGRIQLYNAKKDISSEKIVSSIVVERVSLISTGFVIYLFILNSWLGSLGLIVTLVIFSVWPKKKNYKNKSALFFPLIHLVSYIVCWIFGGLILWNVAKIVVSSNSFSLLNAISVWSITGTIGLIFFFIPGSLGIRELSLSSLLIPTFSFSESILVSLIIRLLFLVSDIIFASLGLLFSSTIEDE